MIKLAYAKEALQLVQVTAERLQGMAETRDIVNIS